MSYGDLIKIYFERSSALQLYWTIYVIVIGGLLAFSSLRRRRDTLALVLITVLYAFFAYKNLGAIGDVTTERLAILTAIREHPISGPDAANVQRLRDLLEPTLTPLPYENVRNFHIASDVLTIAALWAMERRRRKAEQ